MRQEAQEIIDSHTKHIRGEVDRYYSKGTQDRINEDMRLAQIELIRSYWDDMDDATRSTAKRTLKAIGGDEFRGLAL